MHYCMTRGIKLVRIVLTVWCVQQFLLLDVHVLILVRMLIFRAIWIIVIFQYVLGSTITFV